MRRAVVFVVLAAAAGAAVRADITPWWNSQWPVRRTVEARPSGADLPGHDVAVVDFLTGGQTQPDGRDVRVIGRREERPAKVLMIGPGDRCRVAFEMLPGVTTYHVYYGNPKADRPAGNWEPRRGLLLESWQWRGGAADTLRQALESIKAARPKQGADFVPQINHGFNPFGPSENYVHLYTGWLNCPEEGLYTFALSAEHAAFLLVDGQPVIQRGGWGGPTGQANIRGQINLTRGLHRVQFYHIEGRGRSPVAVVAWSLPSWRVPDKPGEQRIEVIPAKAFAPVVRARLVDLEVQGRTIVPDFTAEHIGQAWLRGNHYLVRYRFTPTVKSAQLAGARLTWDLGDGTTSSSGLAEHIYLNPDTYTVTLTIRQYNQTYTTSNAVVIDQDWTRQAERRIDPLARYAAELARRDFSAMRPNDLSTLVDVFAKLERWDEVVRAGRILLLYTEDADDAIRRDKALLLAAVFEKEGRYDEALRMLSAAEGRVTAGALKAGLALRAGEIRMTRQRDLKGAAADFTRVLTAYATARDDAVRWATIRLADVHRKQGDRDRATALYEKAAAIDPLGRPFDQSLVRPGAPKAVRVSAYARTVEAYIRERQLDDAEMLLNSWEWDYPEEKLKGHSALLRARLWAARHDHRRAAEEAEDLAAFDERNPYVPEALLLAGQSYEKLADTKRAVATYRRLVSEYPESPLVPQAQERLKALGG